VNRTSNKCFIKTYHIFIYLYLVIATCENIYASDTDEAYDYMAPYYTIDKESGQLIEIDPSKSKTTILPVDNSQVGRYGAGDFLLVAPLVLVGALVYLYRATWRRR